MQSNNNPLLTPKNLLGLYSIVLVVLAGCAPTPLPSTFTPEPFVTPTNTLAPQFTVTPALTLAPQPTITRIPGPALSFLYLSQGSLQEYSLQKWASQKLPIQSDGEISQAALSPDQRWLVFQDQSGLKILERPFTGLPILVPANNFEQIHFLFSSHSELLAYADGEGLKTFNLLEKTSSLLLKHTLDQSEAAKFRFYIPRQWSPDSQWLWIVASHWEGISHVLAHVPTRKFHEFTGCYTDTAWLPTSQAFVATVRYSGYLGCGEEYGIYLVELTKNHSIGEKLIYREAMPAEVWARQPGELQLSPNTKMISFVQLSNPDTPQQSSRLILIDSLGSDRQELDTSQDDIATPIWSTDGKKLFYAIQGEKESQIISLNIASGEKGILCSVPQRAVLISELAGSDWLVLATSASRGTTWDSLYVVNTKNGALEKISSLGYESYIQPFLGLEPVR